MTVRKGNALSFLPDSLYSSAGDDPSLKQAAKSVNASVLPQFVTFIKTQQRLLQKMKDIGADAKVQI